MSGRPDRRLFRPLPGATPLHRLQAGTKLFGLAAICLVLAVRPTWEAEVAVGALLLVAFRLARVPRGALPRPGRGLWVVAAVGMAVALAAGGSPEVQVGGLAVGTGGLLLLARFVALTALVLGGAALVGWTTSPAELAPALARLGAPFRRLRLPVDEWCATIALSVRGLPLIVDEIHTLRAAERLRPAGAALSWSARLRRPAALLMTALVVSTRRAGELGEAMAARGGAGQGQGEAAASARPGRADRVALALVAVTVVAALAL